MSPSAWRLLLLVMDEIIPADDQGEFPAASENGVPDYIAWQLGGDAAALLPVVTLGLSALEDEARAHAGAEFAALTRAQRHELLARVERGEAAAAWAVPPAAFFASLVDLVAEGYYADPEHNRGNPDKASWAMIGFEERAGLGL